MSDSDNGKDCKHEITALGWGCRKEDDTVMTYKCWGCITEFCEDDLVILTKAYDQAREDVIEAGEAYLLSCDDEGENGDYQLFCEMKEALQKDQPEEAADGG